jgi:hypothetical protein
MLGSLLKNWRGRLFSAAMTIEPHTVPKKLAEAAQRLHQARMAQVANAASGTGARLAIGTSAQELEAIAEEAEPGDHDSQTAD